MLLDKSEAKSICSKLLSNPVAPGLYSHLINVGTNSIINTLENNYFKEDGVPSFKYLQGYYGSGKTQFINSLAARAWQNNIVTSIVNVGNECPFNSPLSIYQAVVSNFIPPPTTGKEPEDERGIEVLLRDIIQKQLRQYGVEKGMSVPPQVRQLIERPFSDIFDGAPDQQTASAIQQLGCLILNIQCGGSISPADREIISWIRGDDVKSKHLKDLGLHKPTKDNDAFKRLRTIILFMKKRMGVKGFLVAFDEGTRTVSFRRGSAKQKQAIENLLTMINDGADGKFPGVMFLYAATPDFRNELISKYPALNDRIGEISFQPGSPMVPFIDLDALDTDSIVREIGSKLLDVFAIAEDIKWDMELQGKNINSLLQTEKKIFGIGSEIRRAFVYHFCILLGNQKHQQMELAADDLTNFIQNHELPRNKEDAE